MKTNPVYLNLQKRISGRKIWFGLRNRFFIGLAIACYPCYYITVIQEFRTKGTEDIFNGINSRDARRICPEALWRVVVRKLDQLDSVETLNELRIPPGNRLEELVGDRKGQFSIRIDDQYRICFVWTISGPDQVEIVDYH